MGNSDSFHRDVTQRQGDMNSWLYFIPKIPRCIELTSSRECVLS